MKINKNNILRFFIALLWLAMSAGCIALLVSASYKKDTKYCAGVEIDIAGVNNNFFIDKHDVYEIVKRYGGDSNSKKQIVSINLRQIEKELEKDLWIKNAELFFDNNNVLKITVEERAPLARVFTTAGNSFYIDSNCMRLPLSDKFSARLPVFTGFTGIAPIFSKADSLLLCDIKNISSKIMADSFLMAMIEQTEITERHSFVMTPKVGTQLILFGDASDADAKFKRLKLFYRNVIAMAGWNRYNTINLQYKDQVVAAVRGKEDVASDSLRTLQIMKSIAENAARRSADSLQSFVQDSDKNSTDSSMIQHSFQRDEGTTGDDQKAIPPVPVILTPVSSPVNVIGTVIIPEKIIKQTTSIKKPAHETFIKPKPSVTIPANKLIKKETVKKPKPSVTTPVNALIKRETVKKPKPKPASNKETDNDF